VPGLERILMLNDFKINMAMIAAFLTIVGYSLNDTIVIFDRLREIRGKNPLVTKELINMTVNQCFGRTLLTAFTVFITVVILYVFGVKEFTASPSAWLSARSPGPTAQSTSRVPWCCSS